MTTKEAVMEFINELTRILSESYGISSEVDLSGLEVKNSDSTEYTEHKVRINLKPEIPQGVVDPRLVIYFTMPTSDELKKLFCTFWYTCDMSAPTVIKCWNDVKNDVFDPSLFTITGYAYLCAEDISIDVRYAVEEYVNARHHSLDTNVREWYRDFYSTDTLGCEINKDITVRDIDSALDNNADVYDTLGVGDSIVRERVFGGLARAKHVPYNDIFERWLEGSRIRFQK